jgi:GGDEF domain-containing protein
LTRRGRPEGGRFRPTPGGHQAAANRDRALDAERDGRSPLDDLRIEINRARRSEEELAVAYVDLVGLKLANDRQGHSAGDAMLKGTVKMIRSHLRCYDVVVRVGGDAALSPPAPVPGRG